MWPAERQSFLPVQKQMMNWRTALAIAATVIFWASAFAGIRAGLASYSPTGVALLRYLTASVVLALYAWITRMPLPRRQDMPGMAMIGFVGFSFYNVALNAGEQQISAGTASLLVASAPIFVALFAVSFFRERLRGWAKVGILLSFVGVAIISISPGEQLEISFSALLVLAAAIAQAVYSVAQKPYLRRYSALQVTAYAVWFGTLFLLVFSPQLWREMQTATTTATVSVVYMGLFPGAVGYVSWSYVLAQLPAAKAGSFLYLIPIVAIGIAWIWLGELPAPAAVWGGLLILAGVILVNIGGRKSK